eukprot:10428857-Ditylum_brightwellii.AAC.1
MRRLAKYPSITSECGSIYKPDPVFSIQCYEDVDFDGVRTKHMLTVIALSTVKAEYIAVLSAMQDVILFMKLLEEISIVFALHIPWPELHYKVFKGNQLCISIAKTFKFSPRTKHIALKYHHLRKVVRMEN